MPGKLCVLPAVARSSSPEKIQEQEDVQEEEEPAPGSASTEPSKKMTSNDAPVEKDQEEAQEPPEQASPRFQTLAGLSSSATAAVQELSPGDGLEAQQLREAIQASQMEALTGSRDSWFGKNDSERAQTSS